MRVELAEEDDGTKSSIALRLWVEDQKKLKGKYKDSGAIEFAFDLDTEVPETVAQEMVNKRFLVMQHFKIHELHTHSLGYLFIMNSESNSHYLRVVQLSILAGGLWLLFRD